MLMTTFTWPSTGVIVVVDMLNQDDGGIAGLRGRWLIGRHRERGADVHRLAALGDGRGDRHVACCTTPVAEHPVDVKQR